MPMHPALYDPNISVYPQPELPPDEELHKIHVTLSYAEEIAPHQMASPYDDLQLSVSGDLVTVAHWIDEHIEPYNDIMLGDKYVQGRYLPGIKRQLLKGGVQTFGNIAYFVTRTIPQELTG